MRALVFNIGREPGLKERVSKLRTRDYQSAFKRVVSLRSWLSIDADYKSLGYCHLSADADDHAFADGRATASLSHFAKDH